MAQVYLALGANLENRSLQMVRAFNAIEREIGEIIGYSSIYETAAWGRLDEPAYLNQVVVVETMLFPLDVLRKTNEIENKLGRIRHLKWGSRTIDIDILFYGDRVIESEQLIVPHPLLHQRKFVLVPLAETAPHLIHPVFNRSVSELLANVDDNLSVEKIDSGC